MSSRGLVLAIAVLAACQERTAPPRERVLARIPNGVPIVLSADGPALAAPRMRAVVDVLRPRWPARFGCVIDAALAADHVAVGISAERDLTVVIATRAPMTCPGLSKIGDGMWVATLGAGKPATTTSVLDDPEHTRARHYLARAPIALSIVLPGVKVLASAGSDPLEGWLSIDTREEASALAEQKVRGVVDRLARTDVTAPFAQNIEISHAGSQVIARLTGPVDADLAVAVRRALELYRVPAARTAAAFECPPLGPPLVGCAGGTELTVTSLVAALEPLAKAQVTPIIENASVASVRLDRPIASLGLRSGDHLLAVDGRRLTSIAQVTELLARARGTISLTVQRTGATAVLTVTERSF
ncbi:MAG: PDZ domain-containing protein [Deltaproteobacteria bacterium]|nr:PDZ domain-containing protein [Deltaproteobacteria bacterium]